MPLEAKGEVIYTKLQQTQSMDSECKPTAYIANSGKACISGELADLINDKLEKNQVFRIETIQQELNTPEAEE